MTDAMAVYRLQQMKEMGVNAIRCVHHPASKAVMQACDRLGLMVMNEARQFGSSPEALRQLRSLAKRDRNHVSIILWSLGNEELIQNNMLGHRMAKTAVEELRKLIRNAYITYAANNGEKYSGVNELMDVRGVNYIRIHSKEAIGYAPDLYHREHPQQPIFSSEEASSLTVRGVYYTILGNAVEVDAFLLLELIYMVLRLDYRDYRPAYNKEGYDRYDNSQCAPKKERHIRKQLAEKTTYLARFAHYGLCINL